MKHSHPFKLDFSPGKTRPHSDSLFSQFRQIRQRQGCAPYSSASAGHGALFAKEIGGYLCYLNGVLKESALSSYIFAGYSDVCLQQVLDAYYQTKKNVHNTHPISNCLQLAHYQFISDTTLEGVHFSSHNHDLGHPSPQIINAFNFEECKTGELIGLSRFLSQFFIYFPYTVIIWENETLFEEHVVDTFNGMPLLDTSQVDIKTIPSDAIPSWCQENDTQTIFYHLERLETCVSSQRVRVSPQVLRPEDKDLLYAYFSENHIKQCRLMFSPSMIRFMKYLLEWLPATALLCIDELGAGCNEPQLDMAQLNQHDISSQSYLPLICYIASKYGFSDDVNFIPNSGAHSAVLPLLLQRGITNPKQFSQSIQKVSILTQSYELRRTIRQWSVLENDMAFEMKMDRLYLEQRDLFSDSFSCLSYCESLYIRGFYQKVMDIISDTRDRGVLLSLEFRFLMAKCYISLGQHSQAERQIESCICDAPSWDQLYLYASIVQLNLKKYDTCIRYIELYFRYLHQSLDWNHFLTYLIVLRHQDHPRYHSCIQFINQCIKSSVLQVPISIIERFQTIESELSKVAEVNEK